MAIRVHHSSILSTFLLLVFLSSSQTQATRPLQLAHAVCHQMRIYAFCMDVFKSDPNTAQATNMLSLTRITFNSAITSATETQAYIEDMLQKIRKKNAKLEVALDTCVASYASAIRSLKSSSDELEEDITVANNDVTVARNGIDGCDKALIGYSGSGKNAEVIGVLLGKNKEAKKHIHVGDAFAGSLKKAISFSE